MRCLLLLLPLFFIILAPNSKADDFYLKNGQVIRNISIIDTVDGQYRVKSGKDTVYVAKSWISKIDAALRDSTKTMKLEVYDTALYDKYIAKENESMKQADERKMRKQDSLAAVEKMLTAKYPWRNRLIGVVGYGYPTGLRLELSYTIREYVAFGLNIHTGNHWKNNGGQNGVMGASIAAFMPFYDIVPYAYLATGGSFMNSFGSKVFVSCAVGCQIPISRGLNFRIECGLNNTRQEIGEGDHPHNTRAADYFLINGGFAIPL